MKVLDKHSTLKSLCVIAIFLFSNFSEAQTIRQEKMAKLKFLVGDWKGVSKSFKNGKVVSEVDAHETISYKLDKHILTVDLNSESLQLHTVIYYDENDEVYYYNPFYKAGAAKYKAYFIDNTLVVKPMKTKRFIFKLDENGNFIEYGEELIEGRWVKYFEDTFKKSN